ncbi:MAG: AAA family ATPase [Isosphaeraceae bacterium]
MYEAHFGLIHRPFSETVDAASFLPLPSREATVRRLRYGLEQARGPVLVHGPAGTGKTLLARVLADTLGGHSAHLTFPAMPAADLLAYLAEELGAPTGGTFSSEAPLSAALRRVQRRLAEAAKAGERPLLIVDEAHLIDDPATFEVLRSLLNFATLGPPDLSLVLVGSTEMLLRLPHGLSDRLTARCLLGPLSLDESHTYLNGRLARAGAREPFFVSSAVALLHRAAEGLPRRLNRLADLALLVAYADGLPRPDARAITIATSEYDSDPLAA